MQARTSIYPGVNTWSVFPQADCGRPQRGQNSVFTDQALLMDTFPEGSNVTLECSNGYEKEAGSEVITCQNGNWTRVELICKSKLELSFS